MARRMAINFTKLCGIILVCTTVYNEYISYYLCHVSWASLPASPDDRMTVILLVADPQIQGVQHEPGGLLGGIRRWDSDRFLHKSYKWATGAYRINTIVFLGDLIDEGSEADDEIFAEYAARFHSIYPAWGQQMIYIPGDNDIGGEGVDPVTLSKIDRFEQHFGPSLSVYSASGHWAGGHCAGQPPDRAWKLQPHSQACSAVHHQGGPGHLPCTCAPTQWKICREGDELGEPGHYLVRSRPQWVHVHCGQAVKETVKGHLEVQQEGENSCGVTNQDSCRS